MTQLEEHAVSAPVAAGRGWHTVREQVQHKPWLPALATSVVLLIVGQILSPGFASWSGINQVVGAAAILAIPSCGQSLVMISGNFGIDLSVGQVMSLTAVAGYMVLGSGQSFLPIAVLVVLGIGGCIGAVNGSLVALVRLPALVVTLGTLVVAQGIVLVLASKGTPAGSVPPILDDMTTRSIGGIKWVTILAAVFVGGMVVFTKRSRFGRMLFLVGSNREAARLSGLRVRRIVIITFVLAGMCSGFAGLLLLSYAGTANLDLGSEYLVLSIAATVIGGTSLAGGEGSLIGAATGAIAFEVINALMLTLGASTAVRQMVVGGLLMLLLTFNARTPRLRQ
jgi:ribose transport system permease protein